MVNFIAQLIVNNQCYYIHGAREDDTHHNLVFFLLMQLCVIFSKHRRRSLSHHPICCVHRNYIIVSLLFLLTKYSRKWPNFSNCVLSSLFPFILLSWQAHIHTEYYFNITVAKLLAIP